MTAFWFLVALVLLFAITCLYLGSRPGPRAKLGPDGTNVRSPESFVVHHEGKGQGLDIANTALKERTEELSQDLPGESRTVKAPVPGRDMVKMADAPPTDRSRFGEEKVAPGREPKEKVLTEGPIGSRPGSPEEPGSPYAKGRRVTDTHRDVELAAEVLPNAFPGMARRVDPAQAASPSTNGMEPGYGLGRTAPGQSDGEGGYQEEADWSDLHEDLPLPEPGEEDDAVVALVRNPRSLYVYWETGGTSAKHLRKMLGEEQWQRSTPYLRLFNVTAGAYPGRPEGHTLAIDLSEEDDHYFLNEGLQPGNRYVVSYERRTPDGRYYMISHSGPVALPPDGPEGGGKVIELYGQEPDSWSGSSWR